MKRTINDIDKDIRNFFETANNVINTNTFIEKIDELLDERLNVMNNKPELIIEEIEIKETWQKII